MTTSDRGVLLLIVVALVLRLAALAVVYRDNPARVVAIDSHSYMNPAHALVKLGRYAPSVERGDTPEVTRTPAYPLFLAAHYFVFGEPNWIPVAVQTVAGVLTLWLTFLLGSRLFSDRAAMIAVVLVVLNMETFLASEQLLTETLFTLLFMLFVDSSVRVLTPDEGPHRRRAAWVAGLSLGAATLFRPITYYLLVPAIAVIAALHPERRRARGRMTADCLAIVLPFVLLVGGWQVRNYLRTGRAELSQIQSINLLLWRAAGIVAVRDGIALEQAQEQLRRDAGDDPGLSQKERSERFASLGVRIMKENPGLAIRTSLTGLARMMLVPGETDLVQFLGFAVSDTGPARDLGAMPAIEWRAKWLTRYRMHLLFFCLGGAYLLVLYAAAAAGLVVGVRKPGTGAAAAPDTRLSAECPSSGKASPRFGSSLRVHAFLVMVLLYILLVSAGPEAYPRFRVPIIPLIAVYAGGSLAWLFEKKKLPVKRNARAGAQG